MDFLKEFSQKDMIEQIMILDELKDAKQVEAVPGLLDLYATPDLDQAVDEMVYYALYELLAGQGALLAGGLGHAAARVRLLCLRRVGADGDAALAPLLLAFLNKEEDPELQAESIRALGMLKDTAIIPGLLPYLRHDNPAVAAFAVQVLGESGAPAGRAALLELIQGNEEAIRASGDCDFLTAQALTNLANFADSETIDFLVARIHHPAPAFRRVVTSVLAGMGKEVLPALERCLHQGDRDEKIMAANVVGWTGLRQGADILTNLLDDPAGLETNLAFAVYEALGRIPSMRSMTALADGLTEEDPLLLVAVVTALDDLCNPGVIKSLHALLEQGGPQAERVLQTIVTVRAVKLFAELYSVERVGELLLAAIVASKDEEALATFREELAKMGGERPAADLQRLQLVAPVVKGKRVLAADDSKAMLFFYKGAAAEMGIDLVTVMDGKEALDFLLDGQVVDLLVTDMNMPNMDGVELARQLRARDEYTRLPILMATTESEKGQADLARAAGVDDFISKPFSREEFVAKLEAMFQFVRNI